MASIHWTPDDVPSQSGKVIVVTGATNGLGLEIAKVLAAKSGSIVIAARNQQKGDRVTAELRQSTGNDQIRFMRIDTADLDSVRAFAEQWKDTGLLIDTLILNAGISNVPSREESPQGFERQFATNYLGHFLLTQLLMPYLRPAEGTRIVVQASLAAKRTTLHFDDLQLHQYNRMTAYAQSKLALLFFALEQARRLSAANSPIDCIPVHPGAASTGITRGGDRLPALVSKFVSFMFGLIGQSPGQGALPAIFAATSPLARSGVYYGPSGRGELKGLPGEASLTQYMTDHEVAERLWAATEDMIAGK